MRRRTLAGAWCIVFGSATALVAGGCSEDEPPGGVGPGPSSGPSSSSVGGAGGTGGGTGGAGGGTGGGVIPDTPCEMPGGTAVEVFTAADSAPTFERLVAVGARFATSGPSGWATFDGDGANASSPSMVQPNFNVLVGEGATFGIGASGNNIAFQRFDSSGSALTAPLGVSMGAPPKIAIASNAGETLFVWADNTTLVARQITAAATFAGVEYTVATNAWSTFIFMDAAAKNGDVMVVWSGDPDLNANQSYSMRVDASGTPAQPTLIHDTPAQHTVTRIVPTDGGYVVLLTGPAPDYVPQLLTLDDAGTPTSPLEGIAGTMFGDDIASLGDGFAVVAIRDSGEPEFRPFDLNLNATGPWVCLDTAAKPGSRVAIAADGAGYATLHHGAAGNVTLHRFNMLGTGP